METCTVIEELTPQPPENAPNSIASDRAPGALPTRLANGKNITFVISSDGDMGVNDNPG